jgi:hypothetical protein
MKNHLLKLNPAEFCDQTRACEDGRIFALKHKTMEEVWDNCLKADWLLWILEAIDAPKDEKNLRLFAVWCARNTPLTDGRKTGDLLTDPRSLNALDVAERFAHGQATELELAAAENAAWAAAWAAAENTAWAAARDAAWAAARNAAWAAARNAARAAARDAARAAARDAAWDAAGNAAWDTAWDAAQDAARAAQSSQLKKMIANPFR